MQINDITGSIISAAMKVHSVMGPGLLESTYEACLAHELRKRGFNVQQQVPLPVVYDGVRLEACYRIDVLVEDCVILELKACDAIAPIHEAQLLSYLKLSNKHVGLLINFHVLRLKDGIKRYVWAMSIGLAFSSVFLCALCGDGLFEIGYEDFSNLDSRFY